MVGRFVGCRWRFLVGEGGNCRVLGTRVHYGRFDNRAGMSRGLGWGCSCTLGLVDIEGSYIAGFGICFEGKDWDWLLLFGFVWQCSVLGPFLLQWVQNLPPFCCGSPKFLFPCFG